MSGSGYTERTSSNTQTELQTDQMDKVGLFVFLRKNDYHVCVCVCVYGSTNECVCMHTCESAYLCMSAHIHAHVCRHVCRHVGHTHFLFKIPLHSFHLSLQFHQCLAVHNQLLSVLPRDQTLGCRVLPPRHAQGGRRHLRPFRIRKRLGGVVEH